MAPPGGRQGTRPRELSPADARGGARKPAPAVFGRHIELPDAQLFRAILEALEIVRLDLLAVGGLALDRDELVVDETPQGGFKEPQLFRQFEVHRPMLPPLPPATTPARRRQWHPW